MWSDLNLKMSTQQDGDIEHKLELEAVKNSLYNIIMTVKGSRRMLPTFAMNLHGYLFELIHSGTTDDIREYLFNEIIQWEDRITLTKIHVGEDPDNNQYKIVIYFKLKKSKSGSEESIDFILKQV